MLTVEPDPRAFQQLERNVGELPGVSLHKCALALESAEATLYSSSQAWRSSLVPQIRAEPVTVRTTSLGDLLDQCGIDRVDLLKLDIEGGEFAILRDIAGLERVDAWIAELHLDLNQEMSLQEALEHLKGFDVTITGRDLNRPTLYAVKQA